MLFQEYKLKNTNLRNRVVMAPMTRNQSPGGVPTDDVISYSYEMGYPHHGTGKWVNF